MHDRMKAIVSLLDLAAQAGPITYADTLLKTANRVTNEAGITRSDLYAAVGRQAAGIVKSCIERDGMEACAETVATAWVKMLSDDVSKRDTVAKEAMRRLSEEVIRRAAMDHPNRLSKATRAIFIEAAIRLAWMVQKAIKGESAWKHYNVPLGKNQSVLGGNARFGWVSEDELYGTILPALESDAGMHYFKDVREQVYGTKGCLKDDAAEDSLTPAATIDIVVSAVEAVKASFKAQGCTQRFLNEPFGKVTPGADDELARWLELLEFCKARWCEVPQLNRVLIIAVTSYN